MSIEFQLRQKAASCADTSCFPVVMRRKSYVAGKRKPSRFARLVRSKQRTTALLLAARYAVSSRRTGLWRSRTAIFATAFTRTPICRRVNPSGNTIRNGFGGGGAAVVVVVGAELAAPQPAAPSASARIRIVRFAT